MSVLEEILEGVAADLAVRMEQVPLDEVKAQAERQSAALDPLPAFRSEGVSVLLNSHLLSEVERVCDEVTIIAHGQVVASGPTAELTGARGLEVETGEGLKRFDDIPRGRIPEVVRELVASGTDVYGVRETGSTLEDAYLDAVGGEVS
jgi:ABC-type multidrug transport system ATPase subunit